MTSPTERLCPRRDDVVAHFLDGDDAALTPAVRADLDEHRAECADCREALARARRLDALVANVGADGRTPPARVEDWLDAALAAGTTVTVPARRAGWRVAAAAAVLFGVGLAVGIVWRGGRAPSVPVAGPVREPAPIEPRATEVPDGAIALPDHPVRLRSRQRPMRPDATTLAAVVEADWLPLFAVPIVVLRDGFGATAASIDRLVDRTRLDAAIALARDPAVDAFDALVGLAVRESEPRVFAIVAECLRDTARCEARLLRGVRADRPAVVAAAARVGGPRIDRALLAYADADGAATMRVVELVRSAPSRPGRGALLLGLWRELDKRGRVTDNAAYAERLFADLGGVEVADVCGTLESSRNAAERARCALALAAIGSPSATGTLARVLEGANRDEAMLAAYALGRAPAGADRLDERRPPPHARPAWLAALASRGEMRARREIARLSVSAEERSFLLEGGFSPNQVSIAARLFRERGGRAD